MSNQNGMLRPLCVGGVAVAIDKLYFGELNIYSSLMFGSAVGAGVYVSEYIAPVIVTDFPSLNSKMINGKILGTRIAEVGAGAGTAYVVNKYLLKNDGYSNEIVQKLGAIMVSDVVGTFVAEYISGQPLDFLV